MNSVRHVRVASMCGSAGITAGTGMPTIGKRVSGKNRHVPMQSGLLPDTITPATGMFLSKDGGVRSIALSGSFALERQYLVMLPCPCHLRFPKRYRPRDCKSRQRLLPHAGVFTSVGQVGRKVGFLFHWAKASWERGMPDHCDVSRSRKSRSVS